MREAIPHIDKSSKTIPETTKPLRLAMQSYRQGELVYSAESLPGRDVVVDIKILLPPDPEQAFKINLSDENLASLESIETHLRVEIFDFVFKSFSKNNDLGEGDSSRIDEIAEDIFKIFCK